MARILITSGPTRQYLDPVRYLTNASSGRMGCALAAMAIRLRHEVVVVTGPVPIQYPAAAHVVDVVSTEEMLRACQRWYPDCDGLIAAAAPCDYRPHEVSADKIHKTGKPITIELIQTPDIVAALGKGRRPNQWVVCFALETSDPRRRAMRKLAQKGSDLIVLNGPRAIESERNAVQLLDPSGRVAGEFSGTKLAVAEGILKVIERQLIARRP